MVYQSYLREVMKRKRLKGDKLVEYIRGSLIDRYGEIPLEWELHLQILEDTIDRYNQVREEINKQGISVGNVKNQLLSTEKDCLATILKITQKLGVTPWDKAKLEKAECDIPEEEDDEGDFIDTLTSK